MEEAMADIEFESIDRAQKLSEAFRSQVRERINSMFEIPGPGEGPEHGSSTSNEPGVSDD